MTRQMLTGILLSIFWCAGTSIAEGESIELPTRGVSAHRGASETHPENTLAAFREAIRLGAHQIEFDVRLTKDQKLVVIHSNLVKECTDGDGKVSQMTLVQLKKLDAGSWKDPKFCSERIPTLSETLAIMPENVWLNVHIKGTARTGKAVAREILLHGREKQSILAAGYAAAEAAMRVDPTLIICNMERQEETSQYVNETISRKNRFLQFYHTLGTSNEIQILKRSNVRINFCGSEDPQDVKILFNAGVNFVLVNDVKRAMDRAKDMGIEPVTPIYRCTPTKRTHQKIQATQDKASLRR